MKQINSKIISSILIIISLPVFFIACQKENTKPTQQPVRAESYNDIKPVNRTIELGGITRLALRPGENGQDTYVAFLDGNDDYANSKGNFAEELSMDAWTNGGYFEALRSYIRFDAISEMPAGAQIISAKLFLYPKGNSVSAPQGNSGPNNCKIERVTSGTWDESTLTWNTQPAVTSDGAAYIAPSASQWDYKAAADVTKMVRAIAADPTKNYGFRISLVNESVYRSMIFASSENVNPQLRPKLVIFYK